MKKNYEEQERFIQTKTIIQIFMLIFALVWFYFDRGFEPLITFLGLISVLQFFGFNNKAKQTKLDTAVATISLITLTSLLLILIYGRLTAPSRQFYYAIVVDTSARVNIPFKSSELGENKWAAIQERLVERLTYGLPEQGNYSLITTGGLSETGGDKCGSFDHVVLPFGASQNEIISSVNEANISGLAALSEAIKNARDILLEEQENAIELRLYIITAGGDQCVDSEWKSVFDVIEFLPKSIVTTTDIILYTPEEQSEEILDQFTTVINLGATVRTVSNVEQADDVASEIVEEANDSIQIAQSDFPLLCWILSVDGCNNSAQPTPTIQSTATSTPEREFINPTETNTPNFSIPPTSTPTVATSTPALDFIEVTVASTFTATPTSTPLPIATPTSTASPTNVPIPTATPTSSPTNVPIPTSTPTFTPLPTFTSTYTPVPPTPTSTPTSTPTPAPPNAPGGVFAEYIFHNGGPGVSDTFDFVLHWEDNSDNEDGFSIFSEFFGEMDNASTSISVGPNTTSVFLFTVSCGDLSGLQENFLNSSVTAFNSSGNSAPGTENRFAFTYCNKDE